MIVLKIIGVFLLILLSGILIALCIPLHLGITYDADTTLRVRYLFLRFVKAFADEPSELQQEAPQKQPSLWDTILTAAGRFFAVVGGGIKVAFGALAAFAKKAAGRVKQFLRTHGKPKIKRRKKKSAAKGEKTDKASSSHKNLFVTLLEERGFQGTVKLFVDIAKLLGGLMVKIYRGVAVDKFVLRMEVTGEDAADTAIQYGRICSGLFPALSFLLGSTRRYTQDIEITPNFESSEGRIYFDGEFEIFPILVVGHSLGALLKFAIAQVKLTLKKHNQETKQKG